MKQERCTLREALAKVADATPEEWEAVRADLEHELAHTQARLNVLNAIIKVLERKLAAVA